MNYIVFSLLSIFLDFKISWFLKNFENFVDEKKILMVIKFILILFINILFNLIGFKEFLIMFVMVVIVVIVDKII